MLTTIPMYCTPAPPDHPFLLLERLSLHYQQIHKLLTPGTSTSPKPSSRLARAAEDGVCEVGQAAEAGSAETDIRYNLLSAETEIAKQKQYEYHGGHGSVTACPNDAIKSGEAQGYAEVASVLEVCWCTSATCDLDRRCRSHGHTVQPETQLLLLVQSDHL